MQTAITLELPRYWAMIRNHTAGVPSELAASLPSFCQHLRRCGIVPSIRRSRHFAAPHEPFWPGRALVPARFLSAEQAGESNAAEARTMYGRRYRAL
jgi:hypothetical protein